MPIGDGGIGIREDVGEVVVEGKGREGREGMPVEERGDGWRMEGGPEWREGEPEERAGDLKGCTGLMFGRRIRSGPGEDGRSWGLGIR
jgi:hypothetical protein